MILESTNILRRHVQMLLLCLAAWLVSACSHAESAKVGMHQGRPCILVDGKPMPFIAYSPPTRMPFAKQNTQRFFAHDMTVYFLNMPRGKAEEDEGWAPNPFWIGDRIDSEYLRELATPSLDEQARFILENAPDARFVVRFGPKEPGSWQRRHPDELFVTETGERLEHASLASSAYRDATTRLVEAVVRHCEAHEWSNRIIGYWTGQHGEGSHLPVIEGWNIDHSPAMKQRWHQFLREKYTTAAALQEAWGRDDVTLAEPPLPPEPFRSQPLNQVQNSLYWQTGTDTRQLMDYLELTARLYRERTRAHIAAHRSATDRDRIFLLDTFKQTMQGWHNWGFFHPEKSWPPAYNDMLSMSGNIDLAPLLESDGLDGVITPHDYRARGVGGTYEPEGIADSVVLRGKLFLSEMDTRTYTARHDRIANARNDREFAAVTWRNFATAQTRGFHNYWMDVFEDWFASDGIHEIIGRQAQVMKQAIDWPHETVPGIAMIIDDTCVYDTNGDGRYLNEAIMWEIKQGLARCGVPVRIYLLDDLRRADFPEHRVFYFPNLFRVTDERLKLLRETVFRNGNVVLWGPGSGISDGETIAAENAARLTGFSFDMLDINYPRRVLPVEFDHPIMQDMNPAQVIGGPLAYGPVLLPTDGQSLGKAWTKAGRNYSGLAVKRIDNDNGGWTSVFTTAVQLPAELWRGLARHSGTHIYNDQNEIILADRHLVALHSLRSGEKRIDLPEPARVIDVKTGETVAEETTTITFHLEAPATAVFRLMPLSQK